MPVKQFSLLLDLLPEPVPFNSAPLDTHRHAHCAKLHHWERPCPSCCANRCREVWTSPKHSALCVWVCSDSLARRPSSAVARGKMPYGCTILLLTGLAARVMAIIDTLTSLRLFGCHFLTHIHVTPVVCWWSWTVLDWVTHLSHRWH